MTLLPECVGDEMGVVQVLTVEGALLDLLAEPE